MRHEVIPTWEELALHQKLVPEIKPAAVIAMLVVKQAGDDIQHSILDVLQKEHHLSEGKFCALVVLHQHEEGLSPSELAERVGVTRATVSNMLKLMEAGGLIEMAAAESDGRGKRVRLTAKGRELMQTILPPHYLRVTRLMERLSEEEQRELIRLLKKLAATE